MQPMSTTPDNTVKRVGKAMALAIATLTLAGCGKKAATETPLPPIATAGKAFGGAAWEAQKIEHDRNVSAGAGRSFANVTYKPEVKIVDEAAVVAALVGHTDRKSVV
jgi:predicted small lipoprotein YifL